MKLIPTIALLGTLAATPASAVMTFVENFDAPADVEGWRDASRNFAPNWVADGGINGAGDSYLSVPYSYTQAGQFGATIFRAEAAFNASDGAFEGDWVAEGVRTFSLLVRHNAPLPLTFDVRFASPQNFPGATAVEFVPVLPGTWTELSFALDPGNPAFVTFEGTDFDTVFSNIGNIQIGTSVPAGFDVNPAFFTFDIDAVGVSVPEPTGVSLGLVAGALFLLRRRRAGPPACRPIA